MPLPTEQLPTIDLDAETDTPPRDVILKLVQGYNSIVSLLGQAGGIALLNSHRKIPNTAIDVTSWTTRDITVTTAMRTLIANFPSGDVPFIVAAQRGGPAGEGICRSPDGVGTSSVGIGHWQFRFRRRGSNFQGHFNPSYAPATIGPSGFLMVLSYPG